MSEEIKPIIMDEVLLQENRNLQILQKSLSGALKEVFGEYTESQRFLDLKRIPLICKDISNINTNIKEIKESIMSGDQDFERRLRTLEDKMTENKGKFSMVHIGWMVFTAVLMMGLTIFSTFFRVK